MSRKILALTKYGDLAASTRQRFVQYKPYLKVCGLDLCISPLFPNAYLKSIFSNERPSSKVVLSSYINRLRVLLTYKDCDAIWLHYETFPFLPSVFELLPTLRNIPLIYDLDDAVFHNYDLHRYKPVRLVLSEKLGPVVRRAHLNMCGNAYLLDWARQYNQNSTIVPTVVDIEAYCPATPAKEGARPVVGWIGSPSTWKFVEPHLKGLREAVGEFSGRVLVVGSGEQIPELPDLEYRKWNEQAELRDLHEMTIGVMPLPDTPWTRGKCGYKLIQYMACGLPVIASPVGVNCEIVEHGVNGFLATTEAEWRQALTILLSDPELRRRMGAAGRRKIEEHYSLQKWGPKVAEMLCKIAERGRP
ncbi:MAG: glycosyltransferase family 4 protein [Parvibaculum sp.]|uniref:glycosyltransferase family 4 protein n=1 Tax=Parvibaculum sp. TaxID=2024848 RepID=UPI0027260FA2|nr:glycosyltransferase family 4 protein [Parvibaculum sp.]MDO8838156.1 glycosyltransferase family 4 protein [Parvibaculum sp.]